MPIPSPIILILGPTAGGKTALSIALANHVAGECICCDSMQVYRGMDIGTAKPTPDEQRQAPHHLIDIADPAGSDFSVDHWLRLADEAINNTTKRGNVPIVVGGTNLYIQALLEGMFDGPPPDEALRAELAKWSLDDLKAELGHIDPEAAARIHLNDRKRAMRAIEVHRATGKPISQLQGQWAEPKQRDNVFIVGLDWPVEQINRRINARVKKMIAGGLVDEVRALHEQGKLGPLAREALGYKQILASMRGEMTMDEAIEQIKIKTRRYAKQQRTWLRRFRTHSDAIWIDCPASSTQSATMQALTSINEWYNKLHGQPFSGPEQSSQASTRS